MGATRRQVLMGAAATALVAPSMVKADLEHQAADPAAARATALMTRLFEQRPAPALSVAVAGPNGLRWATALGKVDLELDVAATSTHLFPLGSISKVLTATVAARLATREAIDLGVPISRWMPDLPEAHRQTTLRQLLTHRGGIRHYNNAEVDIGTPGGAVFTRFYPTDADVLRLFIEDPLVATPGLEVRYSSYGYTLASMVIAAAAGRPFLELVDHEVGRVFDLPSLKPDDPWSVVPARAGGYMNDLDIRMFFASSPSALQPALTSGWATMPFNNPGYCWAGAGFLMTPSDTARFGAAMFDAPSATLTGPQHALLFTPITAATDSSPPLGLGWRIDTDRKGRRRWHHAGATPGGCYVLAVYPDQRLSIALAGNVMTMKMNVLQAASDLLDAFAD